VGISGKWEAAAYMNGTPSAESMRMCPSSAPESYAPLTA
jgi:hypothetical protein